ncbi:MAG: choice-of-anchor P family protein, partial [Nocardioidaceae bacterium]
LPNKNPLIHAKALNVGAQQGASMAKVVDLRLGPPKLGLKAEVIKATCTGGRGAVEIVGLTAGGKPVIPGDETSVPANTTIAVPPGSDSPVAEIALNKQVKQDDGSLTVTALHVELLDGTKLGQVVNVAQAHCGMTAGHETPGPGPTEQPGPGGGNAPEASAPEPVSGSLPVTG